MVIMLVNNYISRPDRRIKRCLEVLRSLTDEEIEVVRFCDIKPGLEAGGEVKAIVLSGSEACLSKLDQRPFFEGEMELVRRARVPVLGICFGHQLIGLAFGAEVVSGPLRDKPKEVVIEVPDDIFSSWSPGEKIIVSERHRDELAQLPPGFVRLATSRSCQIEAMRHLRRPIYGVQFHPERRPGDRVGRWDGLEVLKNFLSLSGLTRT